MKYYYYYYYYYYYCYICQIKKITFSFMYLSYSHQPFKEQWLPYVPPV